MVDLPPSIARLSPRLRARYLELKASGAWTKPDAGPSEPIEVYPVDVTPALDRRHYITGIDALNLDDETVGGAAGWHSIECFTHPQPNHPIPVAHRPDPVPERTLGLEGVRDARVALRNVGHPAGDWDRPVWAALHARAIVDRAFACCAIKSLPASPTWWPIAPWTVADWVWTAEQMDWVKDLAQRAEPEVPAILRPHWGRWREALAPFTTHTDFDT